MANTEELQFTGYSYFTIEAERDDTVQIEAETSDHSIYVSLKLSNEELGDVITEIERVLSGSDESEEYEHINHVELTDDGDDWPLDIEIGRTWTSLHFKNKEEVRKLLSELRKAAA